jgi:threonine dehydratase
MIDSQRIDDAQSLLARYFGPTRIARAASLSSPGHDVFLKLETDLPTGSFKVRGAIYSLSRTLARDGLKAVPYVPEPTSARDGLKAVPYVPEPTPARDGLKAVPYVREVGNTPVGDGLQAVPQGTIAAPHSLVGDGLQAVPHRAITEVVCASTGNHGAAVAYAAQLFGVAATIFLPVDPNPVKAARIREFGARIVEAGVDLTVAIDAAQDYAARTGAFFLHDASDPDVPVGTATIGIEVVDQLPDVDVIYVPMGDTALIRGVASAAKLRRPSIRIVGVVAEQAPAYQLSWRKSRTTAGTDVVQAFRPADAADLKVRTTSDNHVVETETCDTIADGLAVRRPLAPNVAAIRELVDEIIAVSEQEMIATIDLLFAREQVVAEPAGAAAAAGLLKHATQGRTNVVLVTGNNIAPDVRRKTRM